MKRILILLTICTVHSLLSSCNIGTMVAYIASPDPEQEALFELPDVPTVVFIDDRMNALPYTRLRRIIADKVTDELLSRELLTTMISPRDVMRVSATNDKYNELLPINELGKAVDATVVIYIEMTLFDLTNDGQTANPIASCSIRVVDVENRARLFPLETGSLNISDKLDHIAPNRMSSSSEARKLAEELAIELADSIAKVFYTHTIGRLGENLDRK